MDWVLVAVSSAADARLGELAKNSVSAVGGTPNGWSSLSDTGPLQAGALRFSAASESLGALRAALEAAGPIDAAILPAARFGRKRLIISDMDSTIIGQECIDEIADAVGLKAKISEITERAMRGELDFEAALTERVAMLKGLPLDALARTLEERITLNPGARTLIATMKAHGAATLLVSGGFTYFTSRVAALAGFESHQGNTLIDDGAALTGEVGQPILGRVAKRTALLEAAASLGAAAEDAIAMGDGANDLDMIRASGLGVAYKAKPVVAAEAAGSIRHTDLTAALFFQGYKASEFVRG
ncbi:phosphoserine phosphatase SerB [Hyphomonas neptunium ATCC 15444]|uniref:Phosphoserine phosphatase n=2 Tax=Hyphomonas TaxID=85 RepID=Q0C510_HYPNA|nr:MULTISPECIES: phosphoserine phosphatase SerB [Hyphomonas]ABI75667.1 phosphoserine phosphatase SerB [Hyphomonas neptunium ATCC 15444]